MSSKKPRVPKIQSTTLGQDTIINHPSRRSKDRRDRRDLSDPDGSRATNDLTDLSDQKDRRDQKDLSDRMIPDGSRAIIDPDGSRATNDPSRSGSPQKSIGVDMSSLTPIGALSGSPKRSRDMVLANDGHTSNGHTSNLADVMVLKTPEHKRPLSTSLRASHRSKSPDRSDKIAIIPKDLTEDTRMIKELGYTPIISLEGGSNPLILMRSPLGDRVVIRMEGDSENKKMIEIEETKTKFVLNHLIDDIHHQCNGRCGFVIFTGQGLYSEALISDGTCDRKYYYYINGNDARSLIGLGAHEFIAFPLYISSSITSIKYFDTIGDVLMASLRFNGRAIKGPNGYEMPEISSFAKLLDKHGLLERLTNRSIQVTILIPNDDAMNRFYETNDKKMSRRQVEEILLHHILNGIGSSS